MTSWRTVFIHTGVAAAFLASSAFCSELDRAETGPLPGDPAPRIHASTWLRGEPVDWYQPGHVYIVDLWATWCAPCLATMPLLRSYQDRFPERLTVVAMNVWEFNPDRLPALLDSRADSMPTCVAMDSIPPGREANEGLTAVAFLGESDMISIPRTYLVDTSGRIAWIGTPQHLDGPLTSVLEGTWDLEPHATEYAREMAVEVAYRRLLRPVEDAVDAKRWAAAFEASEAVVKADSSFGSLVSNQGFAYLAMMILRQESPGIGELSLADRAVKRALELESTPDWRLFLLGAKVARASGDSTAARHFLEEARLHVPAGSKHYVPSTIDSLSIRR